MSILPALMFLVLLSLGLILIRHSIFSEGDKEKAEHAQRMKKYNKE